VALSVEFKMFRERLSELLVKHTGEFALVCGSELTVYPSHAAAIRAGFTAYGERPFLVKRIDPIQNISPMLRSLLENQ
jgi:hypothetical protein